MSRQVLPLPMISGTPRKYDRYRTGKQNVVSPSIHLHKSRNLRLVMPSRNQSNLLGSVRVKTPDPEPQTTAPDSPSQIPDSQPETPRKPAPSVISASPQTPTPKLKENIAVPPSPHPSPPKRAPKVYHTAQRPPRAASLRPVNLSPPNSPASSDCSISPDRLPNKFPIFTSTPKSKPLKQLLPDTVPSISVCPANLVRKNTKSRLLCLVSTVTNFRLYRAISRNCHYRFTDVNVRRGTFPTGNAGTGKLISRLGGTKKNLISGTNYGKPWRVNDMDGYISSLMYHPPSLSYRTLTCYSRMKRMY